MMGWASPEIDDGTLLKNIAQSDVGALQVLYDRYAGPVYSLAQGMLQDAAAAQQVTWETFLAIWRDAQVFDAERGNPRTWILSLAHHRSVGFSRCRRSDADRGGARNGDPRRGCRGVRDARHPQRPRSEGA